MYFPTHRQGHGKDARVELDNMADNNSNDSKEDQDADTFFDNGIYEKIPSKKQKEKNASEVISEHLSVNNFLGKLACSQSLRPPYSYVPCMHPRIHSVHSMNY